MAVIMGGTLMFSSTGAYGEKNLIGYNCSLTSRYIMHSLKISLKLANVFYHLNIIPAG